jgi:hypothetical protein
MFRKNAANLFSIYSDSIPKTDQNLSIDIVEWTEQVRRLKNKPFSFENRGYLLQLYRDEAKEIYISKGRQTEITEFALNWLLYKLANNPGTVGLYMSDRDSHTSKFANLRLKDRAISQSKILQSIIPLNKHSSTTQPFANGSVLYMQSAWNGFEQSRSIPADFIVVDEIQSMDVKEIDVLQEALSHSNFGYIIGIGTGSEEGSDWHKLWQTGNQSSWDVNSKLWIPKRPENSIHSYHIPQTIVPWITPEDLEKKRLNMTERRHTTEVMGGWHKGAKKPILESDIRRLFDRNSSLIPGNQVDKSKGQVFMGVDWGGGEKAFTVPWIWQCLNEKIPIFKVLYTSKIEETSIEKQVQMISRLIEDYDVDQIVMDAGGGPYQVQKIEERYADKAVKCSYMMRPSNPLNDSKLIPDNHYIIDRTFVIDTIIDLIKRPYIKEDFTISRILIPAKNMQRIEWIIDQFTCIEAETTSLQSGQDYTKYFHDNEQPDDALHACIYAYVAWLVNKGVDMNWISG